jgi:hypothetical protein
VVDLERVHRPRRSDLASGGAPLPVSKATAYFNPSDATDHVLYKSSNNHVHELAWTTCAVTHTDLTTVSRAPISAGDPAGYVFSLDGTQHVVYRDFNGLLHDLDWRTAYP